MSEAWEARTVKDLITSGEAEVKTGPFGTQLHASDYVETGTPVINVRNIGFGEIRTEKLEHIADETVQRLSSHLLEPGDIVFGRKGAVERHTFIHPSQKQWFQGSDCIRLRVKSPSVDNRFLSYSFLTESHKSWMINQGSHGATMASLNQDIISRIPLNLPPLPTQHKIASVLSTYDDLIENNTRRIEILEDMAQVIYREWFVNFRFPGHEKVGMVDSELGPIPEGWEVVSFTEIADLSRESINPSRFEDEVFAHYSIPAFDEAIMPAKEPGASIKSNKYLVPRDCVLLSKINPRIPRIWLPFLESDVRSITSTEFLVLLPKSETTPVYLFNMCRSEEFQKNFAGRALGTSTSHQRVRPENLLTMSTNLPPEDIIREYTRTVEPMSHLVHALRQKNINLRRTRDLLLPKLISGEVDIANLDFTPEIIGARQS